jgi:probable F420-dependent oxidoreductase
MAKPAPTGETGRMDIGLFIFPTDTTMQPIPLAKAAEERGFESLWFPEHSHIPSARATPWGGRENAPPLPEHYWRTHDQFVALAAAAAVTERIKLGTGITLVAQRDPLWLAKEVASLDHISGGRVLFGVGYGWNREEMAHHGVAYTERRAMLREKVLAMQRLWTEDEATFAGEHVSFAPSWSWPKPVQRPHPPILMGGSPGPRTFGDIVEFCDGWMPFAARYDLESSFAELRRVAAANGRDPKTLELTIFAAPPRRQALDEFAALGATRVLFGLPQGPEPDVIAKLDELAALL